MVGPIDWDAAVIGPCMTVFGGPVTYRPAAGGSFTVTGVFDDANKQLVLLDDGSTTLNEAGPVIGVRIAEFPPGAPPVQDDQLYIGQYGNVSINRTFVVRDTQPDSHGSAKLMLNVVRQGP